MDDMDDIFDEDAPEIMIGERDWNKLESGLANVRNMIFIFNTFLRICQNHENIPL